MSDFCRRGHDQRDPANRIAFPSRPRGRCRLCLQQSCQEWQQRHPNRFREYRQRRREQQRLADRARRAVLIRTEWMENDLRTKESER